MKKHVLHLLVLSHVFSVSSREANENERWSMSQRAEDRAQKPINSEKLTRTCVDPCLSEQNIYHRARKPCTETMDWEMDSNGLNPWTVKQFNLIWLEIIQWFGVVWIINVEGWIWLGGLDLYGGNGLVGFRMGFWPICRFTQVRLGTLGDAATADCVSYTLLSSAFLAQAPALRPPRDASVSSLPLILLPAWILRAN